ncbi:MAG: hemin uptake protein HemP [Azospirillum sp.]|nr:hemin uptake protein HemP [Azospirillum sp.]
MIVDPSLSRRATVPPLPLESRLPQIDTLALMGGSRELLIRHAGQEYRLRVTRANKLILTK